ncbi:hypothetical protein [Desulfurobacterium atlanticum]|uniref:Uncharacterized protein n=1 Tax=Desulfurobacterium atlanticum TaxID=240169 RepID=A0A239AE48_9BACT|nr:hypothetical protein [Desulfurobacterium atlanticum]SNR93850.1 hypothetical protein SAMN06265340_1227 [Desulfurobacterium atlanticum]
MHPAIVTVNCAYKNCITEEKLAELIKKQEFPKVYPLNEQIEVFFSEVPVSAVLSFCNKHKITVEELKNYYEQYIKPKFKNKRLEELWNIL